MEDDSRKNFLFSEEKSGQKQKRGKKVELDLHRVIEKPVEKNRWSNEEINEYMVMVHYNREDHQFLEDKSAQKRKPGDEEEESGLSRTNEKQEEIKKSSKEEINEFLDTEQISSDNHQFLEDKSAQKQKQGDEDRKSDRSGTNDKQDEMKESSKKEINEFLDMEHENRGNCHFSKEKSAQKRKMEEGVVESDFLGINEQPDGKKSRSNEDVNEFSRVENDNYDNVYLSKENSLQNRKQEEDMELERNESPYEEAHYILVDNIQYSLSSGLRVCRHKNLNFVFPTFILNDSSNMNRSRESSNMEIDKSTNFPSSEEKAEEPMQEAQKRNQEALEQNQEALKQNQEAQMQMEVVEKHMQEAQIKSQGTENREQQLKPISQKRMTLAKKLVQNRMKKSQKQKWEEKDLKSDILRTNEKTSKNNENSNKIILGSFVDAIAHKALCTHLGASISNRKSPIAVNNDSFYKDITSPKESNENPKGNYNDTDTYGSGDFLKNNEDESDRRYKNGFIDDKKSFYVDFSEKNLDELIRLFGNELNDVNEYGSDNFSEDKEDGQSHKWVEDESSDSNEYESDESDLWYEDECNDVIEYEADRFYENNENELDGRREYEYSDANKYQDSEYFLKNETMQPDGWCEDEFNKGLKDESGNIEDVKADGLCKDTPHDVITGEAVNFLVNNETEPDEPCKDTSNDVINAEPVNFLVNNETEPDGPRGNESNVVNSENNKGEINAPRAGEPPDAN